MQYRILGSLDVVADGGTADLGPPKQRALLANLLLHVGEIVSTDRLTEVLWGEDAPRTAAHSIQIYISDLRKALAPLGCAEVIVTRPPGYVLEADRDSVDAWRFERLVRDGARLLETGDQETGRALLREALGLWRGPALTEFAYEEFAQPYIGRLNQAHLEAIEILASAELDAGRTIEALHLLEAAVLDDPLRERSRELLMLALYRSGRHAEALRTFAALRTQLADELGVDPSPPIRSLYDRILLHDPGLMPAAATMRVDLEVRNPYKGLRAFTEADGPDFFGRDDLVDRLLEALREGARLVSLVGPSGSGKSSVVAAGLVPRLREGAIPGSERWRIGRLVPGEDPMLGAEAIIAGTAASTGARGEPAGEVDGGHPPDLLVLDQFEQVFSAVDDTARDRFLDWLAGTVAEPGGGPRVVLTLRADWYDRPLLHPAFAAVFGPSVVNVVPMTVQGLEAAIVGPARRVGVDVDPALLAELVAGTTDRPGSLPLLQYALTELFDRQTGGTLAHSDYASLGGLRGLLSREAERAYLGLEHDGQDAATQVFLRLVRAGAGGAESRRRVAVAELSDLGIEPVVLSAVLTAFIRQRLLTADRDPASGQAVVEIAHEALLTEWERLAGWIDGHRAALRRHGALRAAAEEWEASGRDPDYVFTGSRLAEFEPWLAGGVLRLSGRERAFLEAGLAQRRAAEAADAARAHADRRAQRRTRLRFAALGLVVVLLGAGLAYAVMSATRPPLRVELLAYGQGLVYEQLDRGFDRAVSNLGLVGAKTKMRDALDEPDLDAMAAELRRLSETRPALILAFDMWDIEDIARDFPDVRYLIVDVTVPFPEPNIVYVNFRTWEASFLAGVAAARTTQTGTIGVIGAWDAQPIWGFVAGFAAGAGEVDPDIVVLTEYLGELGDLTVFNNLVAGENVARAMYDQGADVIFAVAGTSGLGAFKAAAAMSADSGRQLWTIGVDSDQYVTIDDLTGITEVEAWRPHILTSALKRYDVVVENALADLVAGTLSSGLPPPDLASGGVDISYSGGFIDHLKPEIDAYRKQITDGSIVVPCIPDDRLAAIDEIAAEEGVTPEEVIAVICP